MQPPCPRFGVVGWIASPSNVMRCLPQLLLDGRSNACVFRIDSDEVASMSSQTGRHQPANRFSSSSRVFCELFAFGLSCASCVFTSPNRSLKIGLSLETLFADAHQPILSRPTGPM